MASDPLQSLRAALSELREAVRGAKSFKDVSTRVSDEAAAALAVLQSMVGDCPSALHPRPCKLCTSGPSWRR